VGGGDGGNGKYSVGQLILGVGDGRGGHGKILLMMVAGRR